ncbi:MAG: SRPBCC family protein [Flavipsychrobacter sp.]
MKVLRFIIILILVLGLGFLALCLFASKEVSVERSTTVNASKSVVFNQIVKFNNWKNWNPWLEMDSTVKWDVRGNDGEKGSTYHYMGNKIGEGTTINDGVTDGEMKYLMDFKKPYQFKADGYYKVASEGGKTKVTWYYHQDLKFMERGFMAIMGVGKMLGKQFDRGLELLKNYSEAHADDTAVVGGGITDIMYPAHTYAAVRKVVKWADMHQFFGDSYALLGQQVGPRINGPASALYYTWDEQNMQGDVAACFPVSSNAPFQGGTIIEVPASAGYKMVYVGPYSNMHSAHAAIMQHIQAAGKTQKLAIEEYIKMPSNETDSNKYETNIIYLVN